MGKISTRIIWGVIFSLFFIIACGYGRKEESYDKPNIYLDKSTIDFAGIFVNNCIDKTINISNNGNSNLDIKQISSPIQPFSISSDTCSNNTLSPLESCSLKIRFTPVMQGSFTGTFSIPSNDPDSGTSTVSLNGDGYGLNVWINTVNFISCSDITVYVTVVGPEGPILNINELDFTIMVNGTELQTYNTSYNEHTPVSVIPALDLSGSLNAALGAITEAAKYFIGLLYIDDEAAVCKFKDELEFFPSESPFFKYTDSTGKDSLNSYIDELFLAVDGTALYDAVYESIDRIAQEGEYEKSGVIVLSDGVNFHTGGKTLTEVINHSLTEGIPIFSIYYVDLDYYPSASPEIMQQLAYETGGKYYNSGNSSELKGIYQQIADLLSNKYEISFSLSNCTESINIEVQVESAGLYGMDSRTIELP